MVLGKKHSYTIGQTKQLKCDACQETFAIHEPLPLNAATV